MNQVWLDGMLVDCAAARIDPSDRGFTLADGTFTTFRMRDGRVLWLAEHLARLRSAAATLFFDLPYGDDALAEGIAALADALGVDQAAGRVTVTRGPTAQRGLDAPKAPMPTMLITLTKAPPARAPASLIVARSTCRNEHSPLSRIKVLGYGDNLLARREAELAGASDALLANTRGAIACGTVANLLFELDGGWFTPPVAEGALPGLARAKLLEAGQVTERSLPQADLARVQAAYLCNALGCTKVVQLEGRELAWTSAALDLSCLEGAA